MEWFNGVQPYGCAAEQPEDYGVNHDYVSSDSTWDFLECCQDAMERFALHVIGIKTMGGAEKLNIDAWELVNLIDIRDCWEKHNGELRQKAYEWVMEHAQVEFDNWYREN